MSNSLTKDFFVKLSVTALIATLPSKAIAQTLTCVSPLIFGQIIPCGAAGSVTVRPDNSRTTSCVTASGPFSRARCNVGQSFPFRPIQFSVTTPTVTVTNGTANMSVSSFNIITNAGGCCTTQTTPSLDVPIGATISVGSTQASGSYTGTFGVTTVLQ